MYKKIPIYEYDGPVQIRVVGYVQNTIQRIADNAFIPFAPDNTDYQEYLRWLDLGNTPEPADNPPQGETP